jgi:hypothetical protein
LYGQRAPKDVDTLCAMRRLLVIAVAVLLSLATAGVVRAEPAMTYADINALPTAEQAAILDPLRAVANAAATVGRGRGSDVFGGVQIVGPSRLVIVYLTDLDRRDEYVAQMREVDPGLDLTPARFRLSRFSLLALTGAAMTLFRALSAANLPIDSVVVAPDGSGLRVRAHDVARVESWLAASKAEIGLIPVVVEPAGEVDDLVNR